MADDDSGERSSMDAQTAFAELAKIMLGNQPLNATLQRVAELAKLTLPQIEDVSITLMDGGRPRTVVFTGPLAVDLDERQYELGFGPCTDAAITGQTIVVDHHDPDSAYPDFSVLSLRAGITHTVSVGLPVPQRIIGGLNMYASTLEPIDESTVELANTFASYAAVAVANAALYSTTADLAENMQKAMQSRAVIDQAKGILMAHAHTSAAEAFDTLTKLSQEQNRKLRDVAQAIVDGIVKI